MRVKQFVLLLQDQHTITMMCILLRQAVHTCVLNQAVSPGIEGATT
jgi:hypothetical protein